MTVSHPLNAIKAFLSRFVIYPSEHELIAHTAWIVHTHLMDEWDTTPRLAFLSSEPASGKSRALEATAQLVPRAIEPVNVSPAYLFRRTASADGRPTILHDEIDTVFGPKAKDNEDAVDSSMRVIENIQSTADALAIETGNSPLKIFLLTAQ